MTVDLVYINQTDKTIRFKIEEPETMDMVEVKLNSQSQSKVYTYESIAAHKDPKPKSCCEWFLADIVGSKNTIILNDEQHVVHKGEKSVLISNYKDSIISDRHFRYTYTFTEADFENALPCNGDCDD